VHSGTCAGTRARSAGFQQFSTGRPVPPPRASERHEYRRISAGIVVPRPPARERRHSRKKKTPWAYILVLFFRQPHMGRSNHAPEGDLAMTPKTFVAAYFDHARESERRTGMPALFVLAQAALESGWAGAKPGNAMFGIKAGGGWRGEKQLLRTREVLKRADQGGRFPEVVSITKRADGKFDYVVKDWFRAYASIADSFADHGQMLRANALYARCFETQDPREFARRIAAAGYATDPKYAESLIAVIATIERAMRG
jgi:flagellar protein FlgJ